MARTRKARAAAELKNTAYEIFIGILSMISILNIVLIWVYRDDQDLQYILYVMNAIFSGIFLGDFLFRLKTAESASRYFFLGFGWADLLASLPFAEVKIFRLFRVVRVIRLMRDIGPRKVVGLLVHDRANSALMTLLLMGVIVLEFGSLWILRVEAGAEGANITSASDALWYTIVTISTVGYGDQFPVTNFGRIIGAVIIIVGVGIFGTFTGYLANLFIGPRKEEESTAAAETADTAPATIATSADPAGATPEEHPATKGVAAGAASGAVAAGVAAHRAQSAGGSTTSADPDDAAGFPDAAVADAEPPVSAEQLAALLEQSEQMADELRGILAGMAPGSAAR